MGFVCMLSAELGQAFVNFAWAATQRNAGPRQRHQSTSGYLSMWKPLYMAFMHVQLLCYCYYLSTNTCKYIIGDHSLAISGHQGSSLSLKHGLRVPASLNSLHTVPLKTGRGHSTCGKSPATRPWLWGCSYYKRAELYTRARNTCVLRLHATHLVATDVRESFWYE